MYVGTAGWSIPPHRQPEFPPGESHLQRYAQQLNVAEINSSFHRHHRPATYARWAQSVPSHFRFSVKVPRALTHNGTLAPEQETLDRFSAEVSALEQKLAVLLVQLPPKLAFDAEMTRRFFDAFKRKLDVPCVCEPRHPSWGSSEAEHLLTSLGVARVAADPAPWPQAAEPGGYDQLVYFRWHGRPRRYYSNYEEPDLASFGERLMRESNKGVPTWVIFDNTVLGHALDNALTIERLATKSNC